ncbi:two-component response regulator-like PRR1 [Papaver somniferum]|uniref:two-component response regulator-like PRR1 n=1 Tax=Papaver somniferum TaxID=3469 RepID=UPI000E6FA566|nr:two-component response regulator-like PRR1 [Papaver somniferum]
MMDYRDETENNQVLDRGKVRILLCGNDSKSCDEVFSLLCKCSYQVTSARSARQLIDALNAEGPNIDIILSEVDLPISKGFKMLKYIMRHKESQRIPVIMMSVEDEVSVVVKCLKLGAVDYLVKPLRTNELLNLWTHVWRRRKTLGLVEKNIFSCDLLSDPSDANTNSTAIFSDDTDDKSYWNPLPDMNVSAHREGEVRIIIQHFTGRILSHPKKSELKIGESSAFFTYAKSGVPIGNLQRVVSMDESVTKSEQPGRGDKLLMYSKSSSLAVNHQRVVNMDETTSEFGKTSKETALLPSWGEQVGNQLNRHEHGKRSDIYSYQIDVGTSSTSYEYLQRRNSGEKEKKFSATVLSHRSSSPSEFPRRSSREKDEQFSTAVLLHQGNGPSEFPCRRNSEEKDEQFSTTVLLHQSSGPSFEFPQRRSSKDKEEQVSATVLSQQSNSSQLEVSAVPTFPPFPYYFPGMMNQAMRPPSSTQLYRGTYPHDLARHPPSSVFPHYNPFSQCHPPYPSMMSSFPAYYPIQLNMQQGQMPANHVWPPPMSNSPSAEIKQSPVDKREAALVKFRQKKKDRCFDKKIRYVNRKTLAERRTRVRGQFVRQVNGVDVNLNSQPATHVDDSYDDVEDDEDDE